MKTKLKKSGLYYERFMRMTDAERDAEVARFDTESVGTPGKPLNAAQKAQHRRAKRGRPRRGAGAKRVLVTIERGLLGRADDVARRRGISRSELIAEGLEHEVATMS
jgi:hypothetical protein